MDIFKAGESSPEGGALADLRGAKQIGAALGWTERQTYHAWETTDIPIFRLGNGKKATLYARRSDLVAWIEQKRAASLAQRDANR